MCAGPFHAAAVKPAPLSWPRSWRRGRKVLAEDEESDSKAGLLQEWRESQRQAGKAIASETAEESQAGLFWLCVCFLGIFVSFVLYNIPLEHETSGGRHLPELSFFFVTSAVNAVVALVGRSMAGEKCRGVNIWEALLLGTVSALSSFTSVWSLRFVMLPFKILAKACKPLPVMAIGGLMGKRYSTKKHITVALTICGVALFMYRGPGGEGSGLGVPGQELLGVLLLCVSLCFDGGMGALEDKLLCSQNVGPFNLMFHVQAVTALLALAGLVVMGELPELARMVRHPSSALILLAISGASGQVFVKITISKFGALTCSLMGLMRKVTSLVASIVIYQHPVSQVQGLGLALALAGMAMSLAGKLPSGASAAAAGARARCPESQRGAAAQAKDRGLRAAEVV